MPPVRTPKCGKLKSLRNVSGMLSHPTALLLYWCKCSFSFSELCCNLEIHGKSGLIFLATLFAQPWPHLMWWKICLERPSSKQHGLWWCLHMGNAHTEGGSVVTRSHLIMSWSLWILLGFLFASTHPSGFLVLFYTYVGVPASVPSCFSQPDTKLCHVYHLKIQSLHDSMSLMEMEKNVTCCRALEKGCWIFLLDQSEPFVP